MSAVPFVVLFLAVSRSHEPGARLWTMATEVFLVNLGRQAQDPRAFAVPDALLGQVIIAGSQFPAEVGYGGLSVPDLRGGNHPRRRVAKQAVRVAKNQPGSPGLSPCTIVQGTRELRNPCDLS